MNGRRGDEALLKEAGDVGKVFWTDEVPGRASPALSRCSGFKLH